jgi:hypothetical protein
LLSDLYLIVGIPSLRQSGQFVSDEPSDSRESNTFPISSSLLSLLSVSDRDSLSCGDEGEVSSALIAMIMSVVVCDWKIKLLWIRPIPETAPLVLQVMTSFAILYSYMTPISLCVTIEFVGFFQRWTFATDLCMRDPELGQC